MHADATRCTMQPSSRAARHFAAARPRDGTDRGSDLRRHRASAGDRRARHPGGAAPRRFEPGALPPGVQHRIPAPMPRVASAAPGECPATMSGQTQLFENSSRPRHLPVPPRAGRRGVGNVRAGQHRGPHHGRDPRATPGGAPARRHPRGWELIARKAGDRIGMLRAFARSETQAHTDPLTGLLNRRSLEAAHA